MADDVARKRSKPRPMRRNISPRGRAYGKGGKTK